MHQILPQFTTATCDKSCFAPASYGLRYLNIYLNSFKFLIDKMHDKNTFGFT